ncbi:hypothetical protein [Paraburkholderia sp. Cy-641]|uniref:hypothetical protein n=1 Tax=Paraburkholderia sp. Cy-641 TaxID=2608337 RepID=UPI001421893D|nr:hypothetical protein [Paraburkholderia sp. Cy-641]
MKNGEGMSFPVFFFPPSVRAFASSLLRFSAANSSSIRLIAATSKRLRTTASYDVFVC